ncbi:MAG: NADH-quinone oxidoreductase subunit N [Schwartzia succinivorans]|nr:NADH-quinone oxidoreductase subunit N [Schwartzia succinivorans]
MDFWAISIEIAVTVLMLVTLIADLLIPKETDRRAIAFLTVIGLISVFVFSLGQYHLSSSATFFMGLFIADNYSLFFKQLFILGMIFVVLFSLDYAQKFLRYRGEFYTILLSALLGMCVMASANDFITLFVGLELMTISFYILVGFRMDKTSSGEAAVKYLLVGSASTAVMLYGISLIYGATGSFEFMIICRNLHLFYAAGLAGVVLIMAGFFFKLSAIPFHMWAPDVYQGAPTPVTALLAMSSKAAALAVFMRVLYVAFPILGTYWMHILAAVSALCMIGGNIMAIKQKDVKRMLAYSSIAQAGYMMVGMASADYAGIKAVMFYATLYLFANVGAFAVLSVVEEERGGTTHAHLTGLSEASPMLAAVMTISLVSMAGVPPTAGFAGKIYIFTAAVDYGYIWLAFVGFVMSMMSIYYYLLVVRAMYRDLTEQETDYAAPVKYPFAVRLTAILAAVATLGVGVYPDLLAKVTNLASQTFMR